METVRIQWHKQRKQRPRERADAAESKMFRSISRSGQEYARLGQGEGLSAEANKRTIQIREWPISWKEMFGDLTDFVKMPEPEQVAVIRDAVNRLHRLIMRIGWENAWKYYVYLKEHKEPMARFKVFRLEKWHQMVWLDDLMPHLENEVEKRIVARATWNDHLSGRPWIWLKQLVWVGGYEFMDAFGPPKEKKEMGKLQGKVKIPRERKPRKVKEYKVFDCSVGTIESL